MAVWSGSLQAVILVLYIAWWTVQLSLTSKFVFPSVCLVGLNQCSGHIRTTIFLLLSNIQNSKTGKLYEAGDETGREGLSLVGVSWCHLHSHSLDTQEKEMSKVNWCRSHRSNNFFHNENSFAIYLFPCCVFVNQDLSCTCFQRKFRVIHRLRYCSRLSRIIVATYKIRGYWVGVHTRVLAIYV